MTRPEGNAPALEPGAAYVVVGGVENYQTTRALGFTLHGFKSTRRKMAQGVRPGDRLLFYLTGVKRFVAVATVTSTPFEDHAPIWSSAKKPGEDYPYRVRIRPERVLDPADGVDAEPLARRMAYTKKWPPSAKPSPRTGRSRPRRDAGEGGRLSPSPGGRVRRPRR